MPRLSTVCSTTTTSATRALGNSPGGVRTSSGPGEVATLHVFVLQTVIDKEALDSQMTDDSNLANLAFLKCDQKNAFLQAN